MVDNEEYADRDIEDLPPEIGSIENSIFSCDPHITLKKLQVDLASAGLLDLNSKPEMAVEELENLTVMLLSLNPRKYRYRVSQKSDFIFFFAIFSNKIHPKCKRWGSFEKFRKFAT